jgi:O-methyltransferase involved in polyketide biosynthesis
MLTKKIKIYISKQTKNLLMIKGKSSYSAEVVATMRAIESNKAATSRVCYDPFAKHFIRKLFRLLSDNKILSYFLLLYVEKGDQDFLE